MTVTVQQVYNYNHTPEQSAPFSYKLAEMKELGTFVETNFPEGEPGPILTFTTEEAANEYVAFMSNLNPVSTTITPA